MIISSLKVFNVLNAYVFGWFWYVERILDNVSQIVQQIHMLYINQKNRQGELFLDPLWEVLE